MMGKRPSRPREDRERRNGGGLREGGQATRRSARATTLGACGATHFLHDGFSTLIYVVLPVWQAEYGLSLAQVGLLKSLYTGAQAGFQVPAGVLAERWGERGLLAAGTAVTAFGFLALGFAGGFAGLALFLLIAGAGSSVQHPLCSSLVSRAYETGPRRSALGIYNFTGDLGKLSVPALAAVVIAGLGWRWATAGYGGIGLVAACAIFVVFGVFVLAARRATRPRRDSAGQGAGDWGIRDRRGFQVLSAIGIIDNASITAFLTLLPFLLIGKGASVETVGLALTLVFTGGAAGKFLCGLLAERMGIVRTVVVTELLTGGGILLLLTLPLGPSVVVLPVIGVALNGTSSVLYGTVAELVLPERSARAYALFYTLGIGASALAPWIYGAVSDVAGVPATLVVVASVVLTTIPLTQLLRPALRGEAPGTAD